MSSNPPNLKERAFSAVRWTAVSAATGAIVQLLQVMLLTRILTPADYGTMAIVGAVLTFPWIISDAGLNSAFIHRRNVTDGERSSLFWASVLFAVLLGGLVVALAPLIAWIYGDARLFPLLGLSAGTFLVGGLGAQFRMQAEKSLRFKPMAIIETVAALTSMVVAVLTAAAGAGPYTLVWASLSRAAVNTGLAWVYLSEDWKPSWHFSWRELQPFVRFGLATVTGAIIGNVNRNLDVIVLGKFAPAASLGLYSVPRNFINQMHLIINPIISRVGFPLIASVQHDRAQVHAINVSTLNLLGAINAPLYVGMGFFSDVLVRLLFGAQWHDTGPLLAILAVMGYARTMLSTSYGLILGVGLSRLQITWSLVVLALSLPAIVFGAMHGPIWLASGLAGVSVLLLLPAWYGVYRPHAGIDLTQFTTLMLRPVVLSLLSVAPGWIVSQHLTPPVLQLGVGILIAAPLYVLLNYLTNRSVVDSVFRLLLPRRA